MNNRYWWVWFISLTFLVTWGVLYVGYMVDDRVYDSVVVLVQAALLTLLSTIIVVLFVPRQSANSQSGDRPSTGDQSNSNALMRNDSQWNQPPARDANQHDGQDRYDPVLTPASGSSHSSHNLDLRGLTITLLEMMALSERYDRNLTLVLMAIDDLDVVREEYGDRAASRVTDEVADILSDTLRIPDRSGVFADNRFLVILPETNVDSGRQIAERIRRQVVDTEVRIDARRRISVTVSAGVTGFQAGDDPQFILDRVEQALNEAKSLGRNHSIVWSAPLQDSTTDTAEDVDSSLEIEVDETAKLH